MELVHKFEVPLDVEAAWQFANDPASAVPCMPGATFEGVDGDGRVRGRIKVKLGAMVSNFAIEARYVEVDPVQHTMKLVSEGLEARGGGRTSAEIFMKIEAKSDRASLVTVIIQLRMTGKMAQFGKSLLQDVSERLLAQFLTNVKAKLGTIGNVGHRAPDGVTKSVSNGESATDPGSDRMTSDLSAGAGASSSNDAIDLLQIGGLAMAKRIVPIALAFALGLIIGRYWALVG